MARVLRKKESPLYSFKIKPLAPGTLDPLNPFNQLIGRRSKKLNLLQYQALQVMALREGEEDRMIETLGSLLDEPEGRLSLGGTFLNYFHEFGFREVKGTRAGD